MRDLVILLLCCSVASVAATSETVLKNNLVEIVKVTAEAAHVTGDHEHKINRVMIYLDPGGETVVYPDGRSVVHRWSAGEALWSAAEGPHRVTYETTEPVRLVKVELQRDVPIGAPAPSPLDPLIVAPLRYRVEFENEQVRVIRVMIPAEETAPMHEHLRSRVVIYLTDARFEVTLADGSTQSSSFQAGDVVWTDQPLRHSEVNRGKDFEGIVIELK